MTKTLKITIDLYIFLCRKRPPTQYVRLPLMKEIEKVIYRVFYNETCKFCLKSKMVFGLTHYSFTPTPFLPSAGQSREMTCMESLNDRIY